MNQLSGQRSPRVGVIGCGTIGRTHLEAYRANGVGPVALADANRAALDAATATYGGRGYHDYRDLIRAGEVDAVSVCTPPASHREIVVAALEAGIAVLCEKPMATSVQDAEAMAAVAGRTGTRGKRPLLDPHHGSLLRRHRGSAEGAASSHQGTPFFNGLAPF